QLIVVSAAATRAIKAGPRDLVDGGPLGQEADYSTYYKSVPDPEAKIAPSFLVAMPIGVAAAYYTLRKQGSNVDEGGLGFTITEIDNILCGKYQNLMTDKVPDACIVPKTPPAPPAPDGFTLEYILPPHDNPPSSRGLGKKYWHFVYRKGRDS